MATITIASEHFQPVTPNESDRLLANKTGKQLAAILKETSSYPVQFINEGQSGDLLEIPALAMHLLVDVLDEMAKGHAVKLVPFQEEITTQQAADLLNVSRPFFVQLLDNGDIPFRKVGTRRRVKLQDVVQYKQQLYKKRQQILDELTAYDQELGLQ